MSLVSRRLVVVALVLAALAGAAAVRAAGALDGQTFSVWVHDPGKDEPDPDTLVFADGTFRSTACDEYGFAAAPYETTAGDDAVSFLAEAHSETEGVIYWSGTVTGDTISGTFRWEKEGQDPIEYSFESVPAE